MTRRLTPFRLITSLIASAAVISMFAVQAVGVQASAPTIRVAARDFTEEQIAGNLYAQLLNAHGFKTTLDTSFGPDTDIFSALKSDQVDLIPDYLGNGLEGDLGSTYVPGQSVSYVLKEVNKGFAKNNWPVVLLNPALKFNDHNVFVTTKGNSKKFGLKTLSDLAKKASKIRLEVLQECTTRLDCLEGFNKIYKPGRWKKVADPTGGTNPVNPPFYEDLIHGKFDVVQGYGTTDAQIAHFHLVPLKDNKHLFPPDQMTPFINTAVNKANPKIATWLNKLDRDLTNANFAQMNAEVAFKGELPSEVAKLFLRAHKLL